MDLPELESMYTIVGMQYNEQGGDTGAAGPDPLRQRALWDHVQLDLPLSIGALEGRGPGRRRRNGKGRDDFLDLLILDQQADIDGASAGDRAESGNAGQTRGIAHDGQTFAAVVPEGHYQVLWCASSAAEAVDHQPRPVGDIGHGLGKRRYNLIYSHELLSSKSKWRARW